MTKLRRLSIVIAGLILLPFLIYSLFWFEVAKGIENEIHNQYEQAARNNITITEEDRRITGYPWPHRVSFSGTLTGDGWQLSVPLVEMRGFPLAGQKIEITFPEGASLAGDAFDEEIHAVDYIYLRGHIPDALPYALTVEALRSWRDMDGSIEIDSFRINKDPLRLSGNARLYLDDNLQPTGALAIVIRGHMAFLGALQQKRMIDRQQALLAGTVLAGLTQQDPETGERFLEASVTLQNRQLLLGPLPLLEVPRFQWDYDSPPAPPQ